MLSLLKSHHQVTRFQGHSHADGIQHTPDFHPLWQRKANDIYKTMKTMKEKKSAFLNCKSVVWIDFHCDFQTLRMNDVTKYMGKSLYNETEKNSESLSPKTEDITVSSSWHFVSICPLYHLRHSSSVTAFHSNLNVAQHFILIRAQIHRFCTTPTGKLLCSSVC